MVADPGTGLRFAVLGPVRAWRDGTQLSTGSPQQRALLAAILLRGGHTATAPELVDAIWGEEPPQQALAALRTYASRLRKVLGSRTLLSESGGYAIQTSAPRVSLDLDQASRLASLAEKFAAEGDLCKAREHYVEALALWDGEPLSHLPGPYAETQRVRLAEWRLSLLEHRFDLDLQVGCHAEAVSELTAVSAAHPLRERLRELLMLALYRSGRQAEALAVYDDTRALLAEELGIDPCAELSELHQRILRADEGLALASSGARGSAGDWVTPHQLPASVTDFTGRSSFVKELRDELANADGAVMAVSAVAGIGGVGKTTLAIHVAHAAKDRFPDGQLYADLQGASASPTEPRAVLASFLRAFGIADSAIPESLEERAALYRSLLSGRRVLTVLDNARDAAQIRQLLPGNEGCAALITSRTRMVDLAGAYLVDLDVMSPDEAMSLFTKIVGEERVRAERESAMDVVAACGFLPLAIRIAAARLAARRTWTVSVLASKLADERRRLDVLQAGDQAVRATFELGYGQLDTEQARAFRLLGLADGSDISLHAAAAALDRDPEEAEELLESLVDTSLLESAAPGRYRFHDLLRLFARDRARRTEQDGSQRPDAGADGTAAVSEGDLAHARLLDFYLATGKRAFALDRPAERAAQHLLEANHPGLDFEHREEALDWLFTEASCLLACVRQSACTPALLRPAVDLLFATIDLSDSGVHSQSYEQAATAVRDAADAAGDALVGARARVTLTHSHADSGRFEQADEEATHAMLLALSAEDPLSTSYLPNERGIIATYLGDYERAEPFILQAIEAFRDDRNTSSEASAICNLSRIHMALGRHESAIRLAREGVSFYQRIGLTLRLANARYTLGCALTRAGRPEEALVELQRALEVFQDSRQDRWVGVTHFRFAEAHLALGDAGTAATHAERAITLRAIGGEWRRGTVLIVLGKALAELGQHGRAQACWLDAQQVLETRNSPERHEVRELLAATAHR
ncbi:NB-ARC domain-containing protein [Streptomyces sp. XM4193]|uniref:AfsR/SARP family transcriptional regulator n=1 Tax=Streptomyces sp. XM4193 TaxID=2929782 RepID=UPI001FFC060E|nr:BTAD domain-containing putative transcriptional regulator [Streptomyces sp. XM4193]MCK1796740.1 NB-ARC domain-containing protein [Streptomyces sp. XM4193]